MRVIVCGGRDYDDRNGLFEAMDRLHKKFGITRVIQGGATGADRLAYEWAASRMIAVENVPADWKKHGRAAGPIRNRAMLDLKPAFVIAFPGGRGTADMTRQAREARVPVYRPIHGGTTA
ncbi:DUF2493 domain-containing protein [Paracoccus aminovorans]|uniref:DUF2493 domain-containing protein n=1 Tax=Paracoccus aminovorans TaxID=34004 RepID=UPI0007823329|nr:DUF2493 domain-containing protein [Paracoccus aminovorans]